ncbi:nucleotidyltransferase family protein [Eggerthella sp. NSJ-70]|uniref:Nucleotidyltransferase family protein n=1 Tax=Eggerthella hominis TaxID=2763043 RepID=A0ABR7BMA4_9ACTN|nr:nucleotidyltransferase family protein [Eggerthella hominis]MBC5582731.1 nucleotidyltransferase family protein [Eggerthella hominis]
MKRMERVPNACAAVLAAGASTRMGTCKLTRPFAGSTLLERALRAARGCAAAETVVVTGAHRDAVARSAQELGTREEFNPSWERGQSTSVRTAARFAAARGYDLLLVMVADQPYVEAAHLDALLRAYATGGAHACVTQGAQRRGNPCLFDRTCFPLLEELEGDEGARSMLRAHPELAVHAVPAADARVLDDVDTPDELARIEEAILRGR